MRTRMQLLHDSAQLHDDFCEHCPFKSRSSADKCETCPISRKLQEIGKELAGGVLKVKPGRRGKVWTAEEDEVIVSWYTIKRRADTAEFLGVSESILQRRINALKEKGIITPDMKHFISPHKKKDKVVKPKEKKLRKNGWSPEDEKKLANLYRTMSFAELAKVFGRSRGSVSSKVVQLKKRGDIK